MKKVTITPDTPKNPLEQMGFYAGTCWGADTSDKEKNIRRGKGCIDSGHGRILELPQVYMIIEGYSARCIREFYTHIGGSPTRLQESTRYIQYGDFNYITPPSIAKSEEANDLYRRVMNTISFTYTKLEELGIPKEDIANILPLGMESKITDRTNARQIIDMSHQRDCSRAYWEMRDLMHQIEMALSNYSEEWAYIIKSQCMPKCELFGYCNEGKKSCGRYPLKESIDNK